MNKGSRSKGRAKDKAEKSILYTFDVYILEGQLTKSFVEKNPIICRTIQILDGQTLERLHDAIYEAFDREEEHLYEFMRGNNPYSTRSLRYIMRECATNIFGEPQRPAGYIERTTIGSLNLRVRSRLWYLFDFGDCWLHRVVVVKKEKNPPPATYPMVIKRIGESPPQYPEWDDEYEEEDEEDDDY